MYTDTKRVLEKDLKEHNDFEALDNFDFSIEDDWFTINGDPNIITSASGMVVVKLAKHVFPALTTVHVPHRQMGRVAAESLIDLIENRVKKVSHQLDVSIEMRASLQKL